MQRPPRKPGAPILSGAFLLRLAIVSLLIGGATIALFEFELRRGMPLNQARTMAVNTLVVAQVFYLFNARFLTASSLRLDLLFSNRVVWLAVGVLFLLQMAYVYLPFMNTAFATTPLDLHHWLAPLAIGLGIFLIMELEKLWLRQVE